MAIRGWQVTGNEQHKVNVISTYARDSLKRNMLLSCLAFNWSPTKTILVLVIITNAWLFEPSSGMNMCWLAKRKLLIEHRNLWLKCHKITRRTQICCYCLWPGSCQLSPELNVWIQRITSKMNYTESNQLIIEYLDLAYNHTLTYGVVTCVIWYNAMLTVIKTVLSHNIAVPCSAQ